MIVAYKPYKHNNSCIKRKKYLLSYDKTNKFANRSLLLLVVVLFIVFYMAGYKIITHSVDRGQIRVSFGLFGFFYGWLFKFLVPGILGLNSLCFVLSKRKTFSLKLKILSLYLISMFIGFLTGYKSGPVTIIIPGLFFLSFFKKKKLQFYISIAIPGIALLILNTMFVRKMPVDRAALFILHRATVTAGIGAMAVWDKFQNGAGFSTTVVSIFGLLGNKLSYFIIGRELGTIDFLKTNPGLYVTYLVYPNPEIAIKGIANLTLTSFGIAIYYFGKCFFFGFAVLAGFVTGFVLKKLKYFTTNGYLIKSILLSIYFFGVVIPWHDSGGFLILVSLPTLVYLTLLYLVLIFITGKK